MNIFSFIGWIAWGFVFYLAAGWVLGCRKYARVGKPFTFVTATQSMYLCCVSLFFFFLPGVYKLHILWAVPLIFSGQFSYYMQGTLPVKFFTWLFMKIILIGVQTPLEKNKIILDPPPNIFSTPYIAVLKADLIVAQIKIYSMLSLFKTKKRGEAGTNERI